MEVVQQNSTVPCVYVSSYTDGHWMLIDLTKGVDGYKLKSRVYTILPDMETAAQNELQKINQHLLTITLVLESYQIYACARCDEGNWHEYIQNSYRQEASFARDCVRNFIWSPKA